MGLNDIVCSLCSCAPSHAFLVLTQLSLGAEVSLSDYSCTTFVATAKLYATNHLYWLGGPATSGFFRTLCVFELMQRIFCRVWLEVFLHSLGLEMVWTSALESISLLHTSKVLLRKPMFWQWPGLIVFYTINLFDCSEWGTYSCNYLQLLHLYKLFPKPGWLA